MKAISVLGFVLPCGSSAGNVERILWRYRKFILRCHIEDNLRAGYEHIRGHAGEAL